MSNARDPSFSNAESRACSRKISAAERYSNPLAKPMRRATPQTMRQSGRLSPAGARNGRCREMRRSELVTVPDFSPHAAAGSSTSAHRVVSVCRTQSDTTTSGQRASASPIRSASGMLTTGFVAMIQTALMRPS